MRKSSMAILGIILLTTLPLAANELVNGPYLQDAQPTEITIMWETKTATLGKVRYGTNPRLLTQSISEKTARALHQVRLENLEPRQIYYYRCTWKGGKTSRGQFRTAPADNLTPLRFAVFGDSRSDPDMSRKISDMIVDTDPDIILHTGDLVSMGKNLPEWKTFVFDPLQKLLQNYPFYPVLGNHEQEATHYYNYFPLHNQNPWWSVDYGSVHIIGLDTNIPTDKNSEQYRFLVNELKNNTKPWTIVIFHHPLFHSHPSRAVNESRYIWQPLFMEYGVDLALTGHDHYYQRTFPIGRMSEKQRGVVHFTIAGAGASLYPTTPQSYSAYDRSLYHFLMIDVTEEELEIRAINEDGQVFDAIIINKNQDYSSANFVEYGMFELEQSLKNKLGQFSPSKNKDGVLFFDTTFTIETEFFLPVSGEYSWQVSDNWELEKKSSNFAVKPGGIIQVNFKGQVDKRHFMPAPELRLHLAADNSNRNISNRKPYQKYIGFRNQDLILSVEDAVFKKAISSSSGDLTPLFSFLDYYPDSKYAYEAIITLGTQMLHTGDERILSNFSEFLKDNPSDINKFQIYPFFFLSDNFSALSEWITIIGRLPSEQLTFEPNLICQLTELEIFNSQIIEKWHLIGPFAVSEGSGLSTIYPPEVELNFTEVYEGSLEQANRWIEYQSDGNPIDFYEVLAASEYSTRAVVAYAHTTVTATKDGELILLLGSDDDPVVWMNGDEVHRKKGSRGLHLCQDIIMVPVQKGKNDILIKVVQRSGGWALDLRISDWQSVLE